MRPKLPLERDSGVVFQPAPKRAEPFVGAAKRDRILPKLHPDGDGVGKQFALERNRAIEPGKKNIRLVGIKRGFLQLYELIVAAFEDDPFQTVGSNANEPFALLPLAVGQIIRHAPDHIVPFEIEVPLRLEHGTANQGVQAASDLGNTPFEIESAKFDAKLFDQELPEIGLHLVVAGTSR